MTKRTSVIVRAVGALLATGWGACGISPRDDAKCTAGDPPHCEGDTLVICDASGHEDASPCAERCVAMSDAAGHRTAACAAASQTACQTATFAPRCTDDGSFTSCQVVAPLEDAGLTVLTHCGGGTGCRENTLGVACVDPDAKVCDPATFGETCDGTNAIDCDAHGFTEIVAACASPKECKVSGGDARCVRPDQEPCSEPFRETCKDEETVARCVFGFTDVTACSAGNVCRASDETASCFPAATPTCSAASFQERCEAGGRIFCGDFGIESASACGLNQRCEVTGQRAFCVDNDATACDPTTTVATCDGNALVWCDPDAHFTRHYECTNQLCHVSHEGAPAYCVDPTGSACDPKTFVASCKDGAAISCNETSGWTSHWTCAPDESCYLATTSTTLAFCDKKGAQPCDFATYDASCHDGVAANCSFFTGYTTQGDCHDGETCLSDHICLGTLCGELALCQPAGGMPCDGSVEYWCDGQTIMNCFAGVALPSQSCAEGKTCTVEGEKASCK